MPSHPAGSLVHCWRQKLVGGYERLALSALLLRPRTSRRQMRQTQQQIYQKSSGTGRCLTYQYGQKPTGIQAQLPATCALDSPCVFRQTVVHALLSAPRLQRRVLRSGGLALARVPVCMGLKLKNSKISPNRQNTAAVLRRPRSDRVLEDQVRSTSPT